MNRRIPLIQLHAATVLFGFTGLFGKWIAADALTIVAGRTVLALPALLLAAAVTGKTVRVKEARDRWLLAASGAVLALHWFAFYHAIQLSSVGVGLLAFSSYPLFVTLLEPLVFREKWHSADLIPAVLVMVGLAVMTPAFDLQNDVTRGIAWGLVAGLTCALLVLVTRLQVRRCPPLAVTFHQLAWAALFASPALLVGRGTPSLKDAALLAVLGIVCTALPQTLFIASLRHIRAHVASIVNAMEPIYGIVFAFLLLHEIPGPRTQLGGVLILAAVFAAMRRGGG